MHKVSHGSVSVVALERHEFITARPFHEVLSTVRAGLGRPDFAALARRLASLTDWDEFQREVAAEAGSSGLMIFMELDLGSVTTLDPETHGFRATRIVAGNPVTMESMLRTTPGAGSFAPVTLLLFESTDGVHLRYDTMSSAVASELTEDSLPRACALDTAVLGLLREAASA